MTPYQQSIYLKPDRYVKVNSLEEARKILKNG